MLTAQQLGFPYRGWSVPQFTAWLRRAVRLVNHRQADAMTGIKNAVVACFDRQAANALRTDVDSLRHG